MFKAALRFSVLTAFLVLANSSFAAGNLIQLKTSPLRPGSIGNHSGVVLESTGQVTFYVSSRTQPSNNKKFAVAKLSKSQLNAIKALIAEAALGDMDSLTELCEAIPMTKKVYSAGELGLRTANVPCGGATFINNPAATTLVEKLDAWYQKGISLQTDFN